MIEDVYQSPGGNEKKEEDCLQLLLWEIEVEGSGLEKKKQRENLYVALNSE